MKLAASYQNIELMAPDDAALSFFKSPFAAYDTSGAVYIAETFYYFLIMANINQFN